MKYQLENDQLSVTFESLGGTLSSIKDKDGIEFLWQGDPHYWGGQAPVLFPICGSLRDGKATLLNGKITQMPRHGIVRKNDFKLIEQTLYSLTFSILSNDDSIENFPFQYELNIKYTLISNKICTKYTIVNNSTENMPYFIGGHPGFNCPLSDEDNFDDYYLEFSDNETCSIPTSIANSELIDMNRRTNLLNNQNYLNLDRKIFNQDAVVFDSLKSRSVKLVSKQHLRKIQVDFYDFPYLVIWSSPNQGPFIAIEPWTGLSTCNDENDLFEAKRNVTILQPYETKSHQFDIHIF